MSRVNDLTGNKFGMLTVVSRGPSSKSGKATWFCKCDCGNTKNNPVLGYDLCSGRVKSCGCLYKTSNKGTNKKHGMTDTKLYRVWSSMKHRCYYKKGSEFKNYGGRGIFVCDEWKDDFMSFYLWAIKNGYKENDDRREFTIDRIDTNAGYSPSNCRFVNMKTQQNNRRNNVIIQINGVSKTASEWSSESGIRAATLIWRFKNGWPESEMLIPVSLNNSKIRRKNHAQ